MQSKKRPGNKKRQQKQSCPSKSEGRGMRPFSNSRLLGIGILVAVITLLVYLPALHNHFVNMDDHEYVYENSHIQSLDLTFLRWSFGFHSSNWHPLTWISHALDYSVWGLNAKGHHLGSIIIHSLNTFLLFIFVSLLLTTPPIRGTSFFPGKTSSLTAVIIVSGVTALLFGIHPVHVESVAWVSERKDVLSAFFVLMSLIFYTMHVRGETRNNLKIHYTASLCFFALALMSKPMAVTLPVLLLILDIYPFQRLSLGRGMGIQKRILTEKIPFLFFSLLSSVLTVLGQLYGGAVRTIESYPMGARVVVAIKGLFFYLLKMLFPIGLSPYYPYPKKVSFLSLEYMIPLAVVIFITLFCAWAWKRGRKVFMTVWASYVVTLLPVLGIIQVGAQAAADRYTYLPGIGPFLLIGLGSAYAWERTQRHSLVARGASVLLPALMIFGLLGQLTVKQIGVWKDSATLWTAAVTLFPRYERLYINRADAYARSGDYGKALEDLDKALALRPDSREAYLNRGVYHSRRGDYRSSIESYTKAIELFPQEGQFYNNRAFAYLMMRDFQQGLQDVDRAIALDPHFFAARINKCQALLSLKNYREAAEECSKAIDIKPADDRTLMAKETYLSRLDADSATSLRYDIAYYTRGVAYLGEGEKQKAMEDFDQALRLNPQFQEAYVRRGVAFGEAGKLENAIEDFSSAIRLNPRNHDAFYNRGVIYFKEGRKQEALKDFQRAARLGNSAAQEFLNSSKGTQESR